MTFERRETTCTHLSPRDTQANSLAFLQAVEAKRFSHIDVELRSVTFANDSHGKPVAPLHFLNAIIGAATPEEKADFEALMVASQQRAPFPYVMQNYADSRQAVVIHGPNTVAMSAEIKRIPDMAQYEIREKNRVDDEHRAAARILTSPVTDDRKILPFQRVGRAVRTAMTGLRTRVQARVAGM